MIVKNTSEDRVFKTRRNGVEILINPGQTFEVEDAVGTELIQMDNAIEKYEAPVQVEEPVTEEPVKKLKKK